MPRPTRTVEFRPATAGGPPVEVVRSTRRRRSAAAHARDGVIVVMLPAGLDQVEEERLITELVGKVVGRSAAEAVGDDEELARRAAALADEYVDGVRPASVRWSSRMRRRLGSCTPIDATIRISREVATMPGYVLDYVLVHELAHLLHADHSAAFHAVVDRFPDAERAKAYVAGFEHGQARATLGTARHDALDGAGGSAGTDQASVPASSPPSASPSASEPPAPSSEPTLF